MSRFDHCLDFVLEREGGYVNDPVDRGGATNKGITQRVYDDYLKLLALPARDVEDIHDSEVAAIYRSAYWQRMKCDVMPEPLDLVLFDAAVNHGVRQATLFLQRALGVDADGVIGSVTLSAVREEVRVGMLGDVVKAIMDQRDRFYDALVARKPDQAKFRKGWGNRLAELQREVNHGVA